MINFDKIIERVKLLLGDIYYIRYEYNVCDDSLIVRTLRRDCDIEFDMSLNTHLLDNENSTISCNIASQIISGFNDIFDNYEKYKNEE